MSFVALDKFGRIIDADPKKPDKIYDIRSIDITLTLDQLLRVDFLRI